MGRLGLLRLRSPESSGQKEGDVKRDRCRICQGETICVFDLGSHWPSQFPAEPGKLVGEPTPLRMVRCHNCGLIQLDETVSPEQMFQEQYWYRSGINEAMVAHLTNVTVSAIDYVQIDPDDIVVDVGANDGTLLGLFPDGMFKVGYEPASNLQEALSQHCDIQVKGFFPCDLWLGPEDDKAKIITSVAMFYAVDDPHAFVAGIKKMLHPEGVWVNQLAYLPKMLANSAFDSICHEHLEYYGLLPMIKLIEAHDLMIVDVQEVDVNEGSFRLFIKHQSPEPYFPSSVFEMAVREAEMSLATTNDHYLKLRDDAERTRDQLWGILYDARKRGLVVDILGASTKGNTLLQYCKIGPELVRRAIERSPEKVGRYTVSGIPIVGEVAGRTDPADILLCLPWAFRESLIERERGKWPPGTRLLFPLPKVEFVEIPE